MEYLSQENRLKLPKGLFNSPVYLFLFLAIALSGIGGYIESKYEIRLYGLAIAAVLSIVAAIIYYNKQR